MSRRDRAIICIDFLGWGVAEAGHGGEGREGAFAARQSGQVLAQVHHSQRRYENPNEISNWPKFFYLKNLGSNEMKSVLVSALASNGQISDALEMYEEFKQAGCNLEPKAVISLIEHLQSDGQLSRLLKLLEELTDRDFWLDGCYRVLLYSVRFNHLSAAVDLLKQLKDRISNDEMAMEAIFDEVFFSVAEETTLLQMGFNLLQVIKNDLGLAPSRKVLDVLLSACVSTKDMDKSILIWKEYQAADLPYNILSFLRMYQALLASGDLKSARIVLSKMPKDDPHVRLIIQESQTVYAKMASEKKTVKNRKTKGIKHKKSKAKK
ncbi:hypothetical protein EUGRSUZ_G00523 [Eucalyptus grandis]|uniref:Uncharacterized protein n=2 Tax=Eucalyptus grandis TaxID=71139 RepID=A0ACC3JZT8_EUCGR|nr:hypothetical protein EUGRSUZ_G00523 [Eucalyptus grandis]